MTKKNTFLSWGWIMGIVFSLFFILMGTLVYFSANEDHQLVSDNYYEKELAYQQVIQQKINANDAGIFWKKNTSEICLIIPDSIILVHGHIYLYRASDSELDQSFEYNKDQPCLNVADFERGKWKVSFTGKTTQQDFYTESVWIVG